MDQQNANKARAEGGAGVSAKPKSTYPRHVLRIVYQVKDTPANQKVMKQVYQLMQTVDLPDLEHAIMKAEQVEIAAAMIPKRLKDPTPCTHQSQVTKPAS
jgi:hypothetical protein